MFKFYRGTSAVEATALLNGVQAREVSHWTDSLTNATKYSKGAVVCIHMDELPPHMNSYKGVCEGDKLHGTFSEWVLPKAYFENTAYNFVEDEDSFIVKG